METNMKPKRKSPAARKVAELFRSLGQPARLRLLLAIGAGEVCVCHLEAALGYRQAYISQHLMALREAGLVTSRRDGRNIYYRITHLGLLELVRQAAQVAGLAPNALAIAGSQERLEHCCCPHCAPGDASQDGARLPISLITIQEN